MAKLIPTHLERQKIYYHLKKCSSYTAWNRVLEYYKAWAEIFEKSVSEAEDKATPAEPAEINTHQLISVLKGLSTCEKCVELLHHGNKSPFRYDGLTCFAVAKRPLSYWGEHATHYQDGDIAFYPERVPYWDEITTARRKLGDFWGEVGYNILDPADTDDPAVFTLGITDRKFYFNGKANYENGKIFPPHNFPANLIEVPDPKDVVLVQNGQVVPFSGIYEPIKAPPKKKLISMLSGADAPSGPFEVVGAMNYLHANSRATHIGEGRDVWPTTWRLLWKDERYTDGTIPDEEAGYVFNEPRERASEAISSSTDSSDPTIFARSGEKAMKAGFWAVQEDLNARQTFALNGTLPQHGGRDVIWVYSGD